MTDTAPKKVRSFLDRHHQLWFCRGPGKCTAKNVEIRKLPCEDCYLERDMNKTLGQVVDHLERGDA